MLGATFLISPDTASLPVAVLSAGDEMQRCKLLYRLVLYRLVLYRLDVGISYLKLM